jgi:hypothetical protein
MKVYILSYIPRYYADNYNPPAGEVTVGVYTSKDRCVEEIDFHDGQSPLLIAVTSKVFQGPGTRQKLWIVTEFELDAHEEA